MKIVMFKRAKPRGFNYKPIHFDPAKEAREQRKKELLGADYTAPGEESREYSPGQYLRSGGIRRSTSGISSRLAEKKRTSSVRWLIALLLLVALGIWLFFA